MSFLHIRSSLDACPQPQSSQDLLIQLIEVLADIYARFDDTWVRVVRAAVHTARRTRTDATSIPIAASAPCPTPKQKVWPASRPC